MKKAVILCLIITIHLCACATQQKLSPDRWEGIKDALLRIHVRTEIPDDIEDKDIPIKMKSLLFKNAQNRGLIIIVSYIRNKTIRTQYLPNMKLPIIRAIEGAQLQKMECTDSHCENFYSINIKEINSIIAKTNKLTREILKTYEPKKKTP